MNKSKISENSQRLEDEEKIDRLSVLIKDMLLIINPNPSEEVLSKTPRRYAEAIWELTQTNRDSIDESIREAIFDSEGFNDMIVIRDINFNSMCEHHLLPFFGEVSIGYIPNNKILGLSKFPRLVQIISKKMSIQERLNKEIAEQIDNLLEPLGVVVMISSTHSCMCFRGVKSFNSKTETLFSIGNMKLKENLDKFFVLSRKDNK